MPIPVRLHHHNQGVTLIETIIAAAILGVLFVVFVSSLASIGFSEVKARSKTEATQLAREASEISYNLSVQDWDAFASLSGTYHPELLGSLYSLSSGEETIDSYFTRSVVIEPALRDDSGNISDTGSPDYSTIKVTSLVTWNEADLDQTVELVTYLNNLGAQLQP